MHEEEQPFRACRCSHTVRRKRRRMHDTGQGGGTASLAFFFFFDSNVARAKAGGPAEEILLEPGVCGRWQNDRAWMVVRDVWW